MSQVWAPAIPKMVSLTLLPGCTSPFPGPADDVINPECVRRIRLWTESFLQGRSVTLQKTRICHPTICHLKQWSSILSDMKVSEKKQTQENFPGFSLFAKGAGHNYKIVSSSPERAVIEHGFCAWSYLSSASSDVLRTKLSC